MSNWTCRHWERFGHGPHQPPLAVKDHNRLEAVLIVIRVEQAQLLVAMDGIEGVVDIQHDPLRRARKRRAEEANHFMSHPEQRPQVGQIFHPRDRGLGAQRRPGLGIMLEGELEGRIIVQITRIVAIFIPRRDHHDPEPDDVFLAVLHLARLTRIGEARRHKTRQVVPAFHLPQERQTGIGTHLSAIEIEQHGLAIYG